MSESEGTAGRESQNVSDSVQKEEEKKKEKDGGEKAANVMRWLFALPDWFLVTVLM